MEIIDMVRDLWLKTPTMYLPKDKCPEATQITHISLIICHAFWCDRIGFISNVVCWPACVFVRTRVYGHSSRGPSIFWDLVENAARDLPSISTSCFNWNVDYGKAIHSINWLMWACGVEQSTTFTLAPRKNLWEKPGFAHPGRVSAEVQGSATKTNCFIRISGQPTKMN